MRKKLVAANPAALIGYAWMGSILDLATRQVKSNVALLSISFQMKSMQWRCCTAGCLMPCTLAAKFRISMAISLPEPWSKADGVTAPAFNYRAYCA
jgi:hypothetical protein